jgi:hypothetical protein
MPLTDFGGGVDGAGVQKAATTVEFFQNRFTREAIGLADGEFRETALER